MLTAVFEKVGKDGAEDAAKKLLSFLPKAIEQWRITLFRGEGLKLAANTLLKGVAHALGPVAIAWDVTKLAAEAIAPYYFVAQRGITDFMLAQRLGHSKMEAMADVAIKADLFGGAALDEPLAAARGFGKFMQRPLGDGTLDAEWDKFWRKKAVEAADKGDYSLAYLYYCNTPTNERPLGLRNGYAEDFLADPFRAQKAIDGLTQLAVEWVHTLGYVGPDVKN